MLSDKCFGREREEGLLENEGGDSDEVGHGLTVARAL